MRVGQRVAPGWRSDCTDWQRRPGVRSRTPDCGGGRFQAGFRSWGSQKRRVFLGASCSQRLVSSEAWHRRLRADCRVQCFQEPDQALDPRIFPIATTGLGGMGLDNPGTTRGPRGGGECGKDRLGAPVLVEQLVAHALIGAVRGYRLLVSPWLAPSCRFSPSCSTYAIDAIQRHGAAKGSRLALQRICRCHPWNAGGHDPVP